MIILTLTIALFIAAIALNIAADEEARKSRELIEKINANRL